MPDMTPTRATASTSTNRARTGAVRNLSIHRRVLVSIGIAGTALSLAGWILIEAYMLRIGGISHDWSVIRWARVDFWLALISAAISTFGSGLPRLICMTLSSLVVLFWLVAFLGV